MKGSFDIFTLKTNCVLLEFLTLTIIFILENCVISNDILITGEINDGLKVWWHSDT